VAWIPVLKDSLPRFKDARAGGASITLAYFSSSSAVGASWTSSRAPQARYCDTGRGRPRDGEVSPQASFRAYPLCAMDIPSPTAHTGLPFHPAPIRARDGFCARHALGAWPTGRSTYSRGAATRDRWPTAPPQLRAVPLPARPRRATPRPPS